MGISCLLKHKKRKYFFLQSLLFVLRLTKRTKRKTQVSIKKKKNDLICLDGWCTNESINLCADCADSGEGFVIDKHSRLLGESLKVEINLCIKKKCKKCPPGGLHYNVLVCTAYEYIMADLPDKRSPVSALGGTFIFSWSSFQVQILRPLDCPSCDDVNPTHACMRDSYHHST